MVLPVLSVPFRRYKKYSLENNLTNCNGREPFIRLLTEKVQYFSLSILNTRMRGDMTLLRVLNESTNEVHSLRSAFFTKCILYKVHSLRRACYLACPIKIKTPYFISISSLIVVHDCTSL